MAIYNVPSKWRRSVFVAALLVACRELFGILGMGRREEVKTSKGEEVAISGAV